MKDEEKLICESAQRSAEHYNVMIWTIFLVGIGLSLWILYTIWPLKNNLGFMHLFMLFIGFLVLVYCSLTIESFGRKKDFMYKLFDKEIKTIDFNKSIQDLRSLKTGWCEKILKIEWYAEIILSAIFLSYILIFFWVSLKKFSAYFNQNFILFSFSFIFYVIAIIFFRLILRNWKRRPKYKNIKIFKKK